MLPKFIFKKVFAGLLKVDVPTSALGQRTIQVYPKDSELSRRVGIGRSYYPGIIANLPNRNRPSEFRHAGLSRSEVREHYPQLTEIDGGFAEIILGSLNDCGVMT